MRVEFSGRHIEITEPIRKFAQDCLDRMQTLDEAIEIHFILTAAEDQRHIAKVNLKTRTGIQKFIEESADMYTSIASVLHRIEKECVK